MNTQLSRMRLTGGAAIAAMVPGIITTAPLAVTGAFHSTHPARRDVRHLRARTFAALYGVMTNMRMTPSAAAAPEGRGAGNRWAALVVLCVSLLIVTLDNTILNVALPTLVKELDATTTELQWIVDAYALVFAGLIPVAGSSADRFGRRRVFTPGLAVFGATSA